MGWKNIHCGILAGVAVYYIVKAILLAVGLVSMPSLIVIILHCVLIAVLALGCVALTQINDDI